MRFATSIIFLSSFSFNSSWTNAQQTRIDSLNSELAHAKADSTKIEILRQLAKQYWNMTNLDSNIQSYQKALELAQKNKYSVKEIELLSDLAYNTNVTGNYSMSMKYANRLRELNEHTNIYWVNAHSLCAIARNYFGMEDYRKALDYFFRGKEAFETYESGHWAIQNIAETYLKMHKLDSALFYNQKAAYIADTGHNQQYMIDYAIRVFANIYAEKGEDQLALKYYRQFIDDFYHYHLNNREIGHVYFGMAKLYQEKNEIDSSISYAKKALASAQLYKDLQHIFNSSDLLYHLYDSLLNEPQAFRYFKISVTAKEGMAVRQAQNLAFNEQIREKEKLEAAEKEAARTQRIIIISAIIVSIVAFLVWHRIRQLRLRHKMILEQKEAEKLKAIDKMKDRFFSNITHELRTPLSLILSPVELYLQHPEQLKDPARLFRSIYKNSSYLLLLINQLLDISKLDAGSMSISLSKGDFGNYIGDLVKGFEEDAGRKNLTLHFENKVTGKHLFDGEHWKKILNNLLSNAIKFTPPGGNVYVSIDKIIALQGKDDLRLVVKDTGIGINKDQLPFITDRFYQADNTLVRKYEGAGIGLALVSELVKLMNGKLEIESEESKGSVFTITAALASDKEKNDYPELTSLRTIIKFSNNNITQSPEISKESVPVVLIVEDNNELRDFMRSSIESLYKVIVASNGEEGFEIASSQIPDIIISDVMMPVMDGFEFCSRIKKDSATSHIAFIILTAKANHESKMKGLEKGADDYLTKPFSVDELLSRIKNVLQRQKILQDYNLQQLLSENTLPAFTEVQNEFLQSIYKNIEDNLDEGQLTVEFLATKMALSEGTLNRKLVTNIGLSANELIRQYHIKRMQMQKQMIELKAKALRAQMNPHFVFNSLNSIKSLINKNENEKAANYLTTFSKLIRTLFQNSDKREVSLFEEIETCKLYTQLERMRFGDKVEFIFNIDDKIDLKDIKVPALILQPFIENAIWHGLVPKERGGTIVFSVKETNGSVECSIDDDGIGRELSNQYKAQYEATHESKGIGMTQSRLELDKLLNEREDSIRIIDKKNEAGTAKGTKVVITFKELEN